MSSEGALLGARLTAGYLAGGLVLGLLLALGVERLPLPPVIKHWCSGLLMLAIVTAAGVGWGRALARRWGWGAVERLGWAGGVAFGPVVLAAGIILGTAEPRFVARGATLGAPIHTVFMVVFVAAVLCVAAIGGAAVGVALRSWGLAVRLAAAAGPTAAVAFLLVALAMDAAGWRVGAPGAARRATMLTVTGLGILGAALVGGAVVGGMLSRHLKSGRPEVT